MSQFPFSGYNKHKYTEEEILDGIKSNNDNMIRYIYNSYLPGIKKMVYEFHSLVLDANDVFQDGLVVAIGNVNENRFKGDSSFNTYLTGICRNICFNQLKRVKKTEKSTFTPAETDEPETEIEELIYRLTWLKKNKIDEKCREIIDLRFGLADNCTGLNIMQDSESNVRFEEIAKTLNIDAANARQRFKRCLEKLRETAFDDKVWNEILTNTL